MHRMIVGLVMVLMLWGCTPRHATAPAASDTAVTNPFTGEWILQSMNGETVVERAVTLQSQPGQVTGKGFCNNYSSAMTIDGAALTIGPAIAATKMLCPDGNTMQYEQAYFAALGRVATYAVVDGRLELRDDTQTPVLIYQR